MAKRTQQEPKKKGGRPKGRPLSAKERAQRRAAAVKTGEYASTALAQALPPCKPAVCPNDRTGTCDVKRAIESRGAGSTDPDAYAFNYSETTLTIPAYTEVLGVTTGANNPISWMGGTPVIELRATSGTLIRLGGGSSLTNLQFLWAQTPAAPVKALDHTTVPDRDPKNHNLSYTAELTNVSFALLSQGTSFAVDGITESSGGLSIYGGGAMIDGSPAGRTVVNAGNVPGLGISLHGGRYGGSPGCAALMANTGAGSLKLFEGLRIDPGCTNDLVQSGTGPIEVQGGIAYGRTSGTITNGSLHLPFGTTTPPTCSPGATFVNTTSGAPKLCACTAADTWRCAPLP
jgi:hypothetical protein